MSRDFSIVVVDEDIAFWKKIQDFFSKKQIAVNVFLNAKIAYTNILRTSPDAIVINDFIQRMTGKELILILKEKCKSIYDKAVIIYTFDDRIHKKVIEYLSASGINNFIKKPIDPLFFYDKVREFYIEKKLTQIKVIIYSKKTITKERFIKKLGLKVDYIEQYDHFEIKKYYGKNEIPIIIIIDKTMKKSGIKDFLKRLKTIETLDSEKLLYIESGSDFTKNEINELKSFGLDDTISEDDQRDLSEKIGRYIVKSSLKYEKLGRLFINAKEDNEKSKEKLKKKIERIYFGDETILDEEEESKIKITKYYNAMVINFEDEKLPTDIDTLPLRVEQFKEYVNPSKRNKIKIIVNLSNLKEEYITEKNIEKIFAFCCENRRIKEIPDVSIVYKDYPKLQDILNKHHKFYQFRVISSIDKGVEA